MIAENTGMKNHERSEGGEMILIVEDEELLRDLVEEFLKVSGYRVLTANDGLKAVEYYKTHAGEIRVVLLDINLPVLSGPEAFQRMKEINPDVPVIFASGSLNAPLKQKLLAGGAKRVVQKPYGPQEILETIRQILLEQSR